MRERQSLIPLHVSHSSRTLYAQKNAIKPTRVRFYLYEDRDLIMTAHIFGDAKDPIYKSDLSYITLREADEYMQFFCKTCFLFGWFESRLSFKEN